MGHAASAGYHLRGDSGNMGAPTTTVFGRGSSGSMGTAASLRIPSNLVVIGATPPPQTTAALLRQISDKMNE